MIGLDANLLVRYITLDDPVQTRAAVRLIDSLTPQDPGFISMIVMVELAWVLEASYNFEKPAVLSVLEALLRSKELLVEQAEVVSRAVRHFAAGSASFADYLIEQSGRSARCSYTFTFDRKAAGSARMRLLK